MEVIRKISAATLSAGHKLKGIEEERYLGRIYGFARSTEIITTQYGPQNRFDGEFVASRVATEKEPAGECMGPTCYLPSVVSGIIADALSSPDSKGVKFGFDVFASPNEKSATGYEWKIIPLMEVKPSAGLLEFAKEFSAPRLPTPKAEKEKDEGKDKEEKKEEKKEEHKKGK